MYCEERETMRFECVSRVNNKGGVFREYDSEQGGVECVVNH